MIVDSRECPSREPLGLDVALTKLSSDASLMIEAMLPDDSVRKADILGRSESGDSASGSWRSSRLGLDRATSFSCRALRLRPVGSERRSAPAPGPAPRDIMPAALRSPWLVLGLTSREPGRDDVGDFALADTGMTTLLLRFIALRENLGASDARSRSRASASPSGAAVLSGDVGGESGTTSAHRPPAGGVVVPGEVGVERDEAVRGAAGRPDAAGISALGLEGRTYAAIGRWSDARAPARDVSGLVGGESQPVWCAREEPPGEARLSLSLPLVQPPSPSLPRGASSSVTSCRSGLDRRMGEDDEVRERAKAGRGGLRGPSSGETALLGDQSVDGSARRR